MKAESRVLTRRSIGKLVSAFSVVAALGCGPLAQKASAGVLYTSLSSFEAALASYDVTSSYSRVNLSQGAGEQSYTATGPSGYTFTATAPNGVGTTAPNAYYGYPGYGLTSSGANDSSGTASSLQEYRAGDTLTLGSFSSTSNPAEAVDAVGGYFYASTDGSAPTSAETITVSFNGLDPSSSDVVSIPANGPVPFIGYLSNSPITSVTATDTTSSNYVGVDFDVVGTGAVPEPASLTLLSIGGLGLLRRRRIV